MRTSMCLLSSTLFISDSASRPLVSIADTAVRWYSIRVSQVSCCLELGLNCTTVSKQSNKEQSD
jgi:hypothetical protein